MQRRQFLILTSTAAGTFFKCSMAGAQSLIGKQIRLIVPFPAGGPTDIVARPLAQSLGEALKATILIDNRGGAGGSIGADAVAKSAPDGATLLMATVGTHAINASLYKKLALRLRLPISRRLRWSRPRRLLLVLHPAQPVNNLSRAGRARQTLAAES